MVVVGGATGRGEGGGGRHESGQGEVIYRRGGVVHVEEPVGRAGPGLVTTPGWRRRPAVATCGGVSDGLAARYSAAAPATCGVGHRGAADVLVAVSLPIQAEVMFDAGREDVEAGAEVGEATRGRRCWSVAPTVIAVGDAGRGGAAGVGLLLPAATA